MPRAIWWFSGGQLFLISDMVVLGGGAVFNERGTQASFLGHQESSGWHRGSANLARCTCSSRLIDSARSGSYPPSRSEFPSRPHSHSFAWGEYMASERLLNPARCACNSHLIDSARSGSDPLTSEFSSYPHSDSFSTGECRGTLLIRTRPPLGPP
jgi:hypothetical protein